MDMAPAMLFAYIAAMGVFMLASVAVARHGDAILIDEVARREQLNAYPIPHPQPRRPPRLLPRSTARSQTLRTDTLPNNLQIKLPHFLDLEMGQSH